jgi:hypothetical protein
LRASRRTATGGALGEDGGVTTRRSSMTTTTAALHQPADRLSSLGRSSLALACRCPCQSAPAGGVRGGGSGGLLRSGRLGRAGLRVGGARTRGEPTAVLLHEAMAPHQSRHAGQAQAFLSPPGLHVHGTGPPLAGPADNRNVVSPKLRGRRSSRAFGASWQVGRVGGRMRLDASLTYV